MTLDRAAGLAETARALAAGDVTSRALVERTLARIEAAQGSINAFRIVRAEAPRGGAGPGRRSPPPRPPTGTWPRA
jgi:Asp-tRNA(Asn)/Glu-tRNA(Gln) amidotransferase A subunit family amidase